jgi:hypothetical protein
MRPALKLLDGATAVNSKPSNTAATGSIPATLGSAITNLTGFTIDDGINPAIRFVFSTAALSDASATRIRIPYTGADSAATVQTAIITAINAVTTGLRITATDGGSSITTLTNDFGGVHGNVAIGSNTTGIAITGMTGGVTAGFTLNGSVPGGKWHWNLHDAGAFMLQFVAGSGTMDVTIRIWVYSELTHKWAPLGINASTLTLRGVLNDGVAITEDGADNLTHTEPVQFLSAWDYIYAEVVAINGTATAVDLFLNSCARQAAN